QRPSALAASTSARPVGRILPASISASALSRLIRDHFPRGRRGVKRWRKCRSSWPRFWLSIQPMQSVRSSASA
ncbi:MAG TPA: hypothetical protein VHM66_12565, partial [Solirubrobacterales bacterium]|nr:hypothetical protein [Solirubrobacterales bacterium]